MTVQQFTTWSYSAYAQWRECPRKAYYARIMELAQPSSPQMDRGTAIHQLAQDFVEGKRVGIPDELKKFEAQFTMLRDAKAGCEQNWGFTSSWQPCGFFDPDVWLRVKCDATYVAKQSAVDTVVIIDHKTGKIYDEHHDQLELYATAGFIMFPYARKIIAQDWYLDQDAMIEDVFESRQSKQLREKWNKNVEPYFADTIFPCCPSPRCRYCAFSKANLGPCDF